MFSTMFASGFHQQELALRLVIEPKKRV